ncbi:multidrug resistance regulator 1 [[Candida] anglica]|uniref:Multidrug resistance regulator 1 n=1 Tax=[Candida] anglica TaxID=148631 RepID=A0ABP0E913_9ASCO
MSDRKRNRMTLVCTTCKKRKVKCDKGRPCSSCIKFKSQSSCVYPDESWPEIKTPTAGVALTEPGSATTFDGYPNRNTNVAIAPIDNRTDRPLPYEVTQPSPYPPTYPTPIQMYGTPVYVDKPPVEISQQVGPPSQDPRRTDMYRPHPMYLVEQQQRSNLIPSKRPVEPTNKDPMARSEELKDKINQIEASITVANLFQAGHPTHGNSPRDYANYSQWQSPLDGSYRQQNYRTPHSVPLPAHPQGLDNEKQNSPAAGNNLKSIPSSGQDSPVQLPPINWVNNQTGNNSAGIVFDHKGNPTTLSKYVGINPIASPFETINFYDKYTDIHFKELKKRFNPGPFSWLSIVKKDHSVMYLWKHILYSRGFKTKLFPGQEGHTSVSVSCLQDFSSKEDSSIDSKVANNTEKEFTERALDRDGYNDIRPFDQRKDKPESSEMSEEEKITEQRIKMNENALSRGLTLFEGKMNQELKLIEKIQVVLPPQKVIWMLINRFFKTVYPYLPIIDEGLFKGEMVKILGPESYSTKKSITLKINKRLEFANIGILLLILRFTYLSLFSNRNGVNEQNLHSKDTSNKAKDLKYLLSNPINIDVVGIAQLCLEQFQILQKPSIEVLQCSLLMRLYYKYAPEDGDGADGGKSQITSGLLISMAYSIGIHREPEYPIDPEEEKIANISRKIWYILVITDLIQAFTFGHPMIVDPNVYDTKVPFFTKKNANIADAELEKHIVGSFLYSDRFLSMIKSILDMCLDLKSFVNVKELTERISDYEQFLEHTFGSLNDLLTPFDAKAFGYPFLKAQKCRQYLHLKYFSLSLYIHLFLYYENKGKADLSFFYLRKMLTNSNSELLPYFANLIGNMHTYFEEGASLFLNPTIEETLHKCNQINFLVIVRLNMRIHKMKYSSQHKNLQNTDPAYKMLFARLCKLSSNMEKCAEICISALMTLSNRYYFAWRISKSHQFLLSVMYQDDVYSQSDSETGMSFVLSLEQINELITITNVPLAKYKRKLPPGVRSGSDFPTATTTVAAPVSTTEPPPIDPKQDSRRLSKHILDFPWNESSASTVDSSNSMSDPDELNLMNSDVIDQLWFQIASMKNGNVPEFTDDLPHTVYNSNYNDINTPINNGGQQRNTQRKDMENSNGRHHYGNTDESSTFFGDFDMFPFDLNSELPVDINIAKSGATDELLSGNK